MARYARRQKLINSSLQLKLVGTFLAVATSATCLQVILMNKSILDLSSELSSEGDVLLAQRVPGILAANILITLLILVPLMLTVGILVTHRIAGPVYRMERYLREVVRDGKVTVPCRIRDKDELQELCNLMNAALAAVTSDAEESSEEAPELEEVQGLVADEESVDAETAETVSVDEQRA